MATNEQLLGKAQPGSLADRLAQDALARKLLGETQSGSLADKQKKSGG